MDYEVGDIVKLKKQHPCGSKEWRILRVGADFRLECMSPLHHRDGCRHPFPLAVQSPLPGHSDGDRIREPALQPT